MGEDSGGANVDKALSYKCMKTPQRYCGVGVEAVGAGKRLDTITPEATVSHDLCASLQPRLWGQVTLLKLIQILERGSQAGAQKMLDGSGNSCTAS